MTWEGWIQSHLPIIYLTLRTSGLVSKNVDPTLPPVEKYPGMKGLRELMGGRDMLHLQFQLVLLSLLV